MKVLILLYLFLPMTFAIQYIVTDSSLENLTISKAELKALANDLARVNSNSASRAVGKRAQRRCARKEQVKRRCDDWMKSPAQPSKELLKDRSLTDQGHICFAQRLMSSLGIEPATEHARQRSSNAPSDSCNATHRIHPAELP